MTTQSEIAEGVGVEQPTVTNLSKKGKLSQITQLLAEETDDKDTLAQQGIVPEDLGDHLLSILPRCTMMVRRPLKVTLGKVAKRTVNDLALVQVAVLGNGYLALVQDSHCHLLHGSGGRATDLLTPALTVWQIEVNPPRIVFDEDTHHASFFLGGLPTLTFVLAFSCTLFR